MGMLLITSTGYAEQTAEQEQPSLELLEFLGEWVTEEGEWLDPEQFEEDGFADMLHLTEQEQNDETAE